MSPSPLKRGKGFWRFNNSLLKDAYFLESCNKTIAGTMKMYSADLQRYKNPDSKTCATAEFKIGHNLLHDVIMMEACAYTMKYTANKRREEVCIKHSLQAKIVEI